MNKVFRVGLFGAINSSRALPLFLASRNKRRCPKIARQAPLPEPRCPRHQKPMDSGG